MTEPTPSHFYAIDWLVLLAYFAATMGIGFYFYRKSQTSDGFTAANRSLPGWVCGLSILATYVSSVSYLALPGKAFTDNWNPFVFSLSIPLVACIAVRYFLPYYRTSGEVSAYALLERRFGLWARVYGSVFYLLTQIARIAVVMYLMALPMQVIFGWNIYTILMITGASVTIYSSMGGILAVIWADAIQAVVLMVGAVISLAVMLARLPGGPEQVFHVAAQQGKFSLGSLGPNLSESTFWVVLAYGIVINLQNFGIDQSYIQRYIASRSDREARRSLWLGALLYIPLSALFFFVGTTLYVFYTAADRSPGKETGIAASLSPGDATHEPIVSEMDELRHIVARQRLVRQGLAPEDPAFAARQADVAASLELVELGDRAFPHFIAKHLPPGLTGLLIAAVFAAAMSTISTSLNSSATLVMTDYYRRLINPAASERQSMVVLHAATIVWGILGTGLALWLVKLTESALDIWWTLAGIFGGGITGLFLLGMIIRQARSPAAVAGVVVGVLTIFWLSLPTFLELLAELPKETIVYGFAVTMKQLTAGWGSPFHAYMIPVIGTMTIFVVGWLASQAATAYTNRRTVGKPESVE